VLVLLLNSNFSESHFYILREYFSAGVHSDMDSEWYREVGSIFVKTALINAVQRPLFFCVQFLKV
jgi:hypothetical protein